MVVMALFQLRFLQNASILMGFILFRIFLLIPDVIQGMVSADLLVLERMYLSTVSCMKEVIKLKFS